MPWHERIAPVDFGGIKDLIPIPAVLTRIGWKVVQKCGTTLKGNCPIHSTGLRASTSFGFRRYVWYCHTCKEGGDVVRLWAKIHGLSDLAAAINLCGAFGIPVPRRSG